MPDHHHHHHHHSGRVPAMTGWDSMREARWTLALTLAAIGGTTLLCLGIGQARKAIKKSRGKEKGRVAALYVYPIKSCAGVEVSAQAIESRGFVCDRLWMLIDGTTGRFITQRQVPKMALIKPVLPKDTYQPLEVNAPGMPKLIVPILKDGVVHGVRVWGDHVEGIDQGDEAAKWFSAFLGQENVRLVRFRDGFEREVDVEFAGRGHHTGFADGFPFLLVSEASLAELNSRLSEPIPMNRFRPNIVVRGVEPFEEDGWDDISIGSIAMRVVKPCSRCKMPTIDQDTGLSSEEPSKTLQTFRTGEALNLDNPKWKKEWFFAQNVVHMRGAKGSIAVGDSVVVYT